MKQPKVSVLISAYNAEETIGRCLDSIIAQTYHDFEIILVNDGSSDNTLSIITTFEDERLQVVDLPHMGLQKALNTGLTYCTGMYIARMDADDWSYPERLARQVKILDTDSTIGVVSGLVEYAGDRDKNKGYALHVDWVNSLQSHAEMYLNRFEDSPIVNPSSMFRKSLVDVYGAYSEDAIPEDYEFWMRLFHHNIKFHKVPYPVLKWYDLDKRITRTSEHYSSNAFQKVKTHYLLKQLKFDSFKHIFIFGTGKTVNKKIKSLISHGIVVNKFLEVKDGPYTSNNIVHYTELPQYSGQEYVLSYVGDRAGKVRIRRYLEELNYTLGKSFFFMC